MVDQSVWNKPHHIAKVDRRGNETIVAQYDNGVRSEGMAQVYGCLDPSSRYESRLGDATDKLEQKRGWFGGGGRYQVTEINPSGDRECYGIFGDLARADLAKRGGEGHALGTNSGCRYVVKKV